MSEGKGAIDEIKRKYTSKKELTWAAVKEEDEINVEELMLAGKAIRRSEYKHFRTGKKKANTL